MMSFVSISRIDISHEQKEKNLKMPEKEQDRQKIVKAVMKDVDRGKTVKIYFIYNVYKWFLIFSNAYFVQIIFHMAAGF